MALIQRRPPPGLVHHSDRGVQYASHAYTEMLKQHHATLSMSRKGNPYDKDYASYRRNRWYRIKWPGQTQLQPAWAEKFFDNHTEAFDYAERRRAEHPTGRVHRPVQSHEKPAAWAVCVDPQHPSPPTSIFC